MKPTALILPMALMATLAPLDVSARGWVEESDAITHRVLEAQAAFVPETASSLGLEQFDDEVMDLRKDRVEREIAENERLLEWLAERKRTVEHPKALQDVEILQTSIRDSIVTARLQRDTLLPYHNLAQNLYFGFRSLLDPRNDPGRYPAALERLEKYTGRHEGYRPIAELARDRTEERFGVPGLTPPYKAEVERDRENLDRFLAGMRQVFSESGLTGWEEGFAALEEQLQAYDAWLAGEVLPRARTNHRLPEALYADNLKNFGVRADPGTLIRTAQAGFQEIRGQMKSVARQIADARGWENGELMHVMERLKQDQIPQDRILDIYAQRLEAIEAIIRREEIVSLPDRAANIRLATEAESASIPAPFMSPPQLIGNTGQYGEFVLVQTNPALEGQESRMDDWSHEHITWALTVHEARPGHEMQFSALIENGTSLARAIYAFNSANVEGWGLYAEAIMMEHLPLEGQLFTLQARLQRAARMFLDPMVNLGQLRPAEAVRFMQEQVGLSSAMANSEADRYAFRAPGQATSYYYGYRNLQRLRTEVELKLGDRFDQRAFHDFILDQGLLPPELLREAVLSGFVAAR